MIQTMLSAALLLSAPLESRTDDPVTEDNADAAALTYDEAVTCAFVTMSVGLGLSKSEAEPEQARGSDLLGLLADFLDYAAQIRGTTQDEVVTDLSARSTGIADTIKASEEPATTLNRMVSECEERSAALA